MSKIPSALKKIVRQNEIKKSSKKRRKTINYSGKPKFIIRNSFIQLLGFSNDILDEIVKNLSYHNKEAEFEKKLILKTLKYVAYCKKNNTVPNWIIKRCNQLHMNLNEYYQHLKIKLNKAKDAENVCLLDEDGYFPTGLFYNVIETLKNGFKELKVEVDDLRAIPEQKVRFKWKSEPFMPRYYQEDMRKLAKEHERGVFESCVGSGKTLIMANIVFDKRVNVMIVLPSKALLNQTYNVFSKLFGKTKVQKLSSEKIKKGIKLAPIRLITIQSLASLQKNNIVKKLTQNIDMVMIDEIHHSGSKTYQDLMSEIDHVYYRYGFTGTFLRNDSKTMNMHGFLSHVLYYYPSSKAIEDGYITKVEFIIHQLKGKKSGNYQQEYKNNYCGSEKILKEIAEIVRNIPENQQILILTKQKEGSGKLIHKFLNKLKISNTYISGDDKSNDIDYAIQKFNDKDIRILIGTKVIGEGVDVHSTQHLILATGGKSEVEIVQAIGRCVRLHEGKDKSYVYDFQFERTKYMEKHLEERLRIFQNQFAGEIKYAGRKDL